MFDRWRRTTEQLFSFLEYLFVKLFFLVMALIGMWAVIHWHLR